MHERKSLTDILRSGNSGGWINSDWNNVAPAPEFAPLPPGKYIAHLTEKEGHESRNSTPSVKLTFTVCEGEHKGRKLWYDVWLTDAARGQARRDLAKLGITSKDQLEKPLPADKRIRCELRVIIRTGDNGDTFNVVRGFETIGVDDVPADPFAPPPVDTSAPADAPAPSDTDAGMPPLDPAAPRPSLFGQGQGQGEGNGAYRGERR